MRSRELPLLPRSLDTLSFRRSSSGSAAEAIYGRRVFSNSYTKSPTISLQSLSVEDDQHLLDGNRDSIVDSQEPVIEYDEYGNKIFTREVVLNLKTSLSYKRAKDSKKCGNNLGIKIDWVRGQVHVIHVIKGSVAENCGLCLGDEIVEINSHAIDDGFSIETINELLSYAESEMKLIIKDHRGKHVTIQGDANRLSSPFGITVREGKVTHVEPGSPAAKHNIETGLGIVSMNGKSALGKSDSYITKKLNHIHKKTLSLSLLDGALRDELTKRFVGCNSDPTHISIGSASSTVTAVNTSESVASSGGS